MDTTTWIAVAFIIFASGLLSLLTGVKKSRKKKSYRYQKRPNLLTPHELKFYKSLLPAAISRQLVVCPKVRLADLIEPQKNSQSFQAAFSKISAKHIDFVLCDSQSMQPLLALELDDSSHDRKDRRERDKFVDRALEMSGIPVLHTRTTSGLEQNIAAALQKKTAKIR